MAAFVILEAVCAAGPAEEILRRYGVHRDRARVENELRTKAAGDPLAHCVLAGFTETRGEWPAAQSHWKTCGNALALERATLVEGWKAGYTPTRAQRAGLLRNEAEQRLGARDFDGACRAAGEAKTHDRLHWRNDAIAAVCLMERNDGEGALRSVTAALALAPPSEERQGLEQLASALRQQIGAARLMEEANEALASGDRATAEDKAAQAWNGGEGSSEAGWVLVRLASLRGDRARACGAVRELAGKKDPAAAQLLVRWRAECGENK